MANPNANLAPSEDVKRFFNAINEGDARTLRKIAAAHPKILKWQTSPGSLLHYAAMQSKSVSVIKCLHELGLEIDESPDGEGGTPLYYACSASGVDEVVKYLIKHGADVNAGAGKWAAPIHCASGANRPRAVRLLLQHGADPGFEDVEGETPLAIAKRREFGEVIEVLQDFNAPLVGKKIEKPPARVANIDLSKAATQIEKLVRRAIRRFVKEHRKEPVTAVALHGSGIHGFVSVCLETGEFKGDVPGMKYAQFETLEFPKWQEAYEYAQHIRLTTYTGRVRNMSGCGGTADKRFQEPFFDLLVHLLRTLAAARAFGPVVRASNFQIGVEIMDGTHAKFWKVK